MSGAEPASAGKQGAVCIVLHTHLPYIHHPDFEDFLEEDWLFEAITDCYLPILFVLDDLRRDAVPFRLAFSMTPPLLHMLRTPDLLDKFDGYLDKRGRLAALEAERRTGDDAMARTAAHYGRRFAQMAELWQAIDRDIPGAFRRLADQGLVEILASAATHGFLPLLGEESAVRAQIQLGADHHEEVFGRRARGFWLPECAYRPGLETLLADAGIEYVVLDSHGLELARPQPAAGTARPVDLGHGVAAFGRDAACSQQVWSSMVGYPGDPAYRELYRDLGYDAEYGYIRPFLKPDGIRRHVGLKYHRVTGAVPLHEKEPYEPEAARIRAGVHAADFVLKRAAQLRDRADLTAAPCVLAPFDTELFGHWWYEGPHFLEGVFREAWRQADSLPFALRTPSEVLDRPGDRPLVAVPSCTWGEGGYNHVWLNEKNHRFWPHVHEMEARMARHAGAVAALGELERRVLAQMGRELLLAESSDWAFIQTMQTATWYAERRFRDHVHRFFELERALESGDIDPVELGRLETHDAIFPDLDPTVFA